MNQHLDARRSLRDAVEQVLSSEAPEQVVRSIPAQSLYVSMRRRGLASSLEVIELLSRDQLQTVLDFDLWEGDRFAEERIWEWLELPDVDNDLSILQRILSALDLKFVCLLIARHVEAATFEDPTDNPPAPHFYTPDKGYTWINVSHEEESKQFLLARLLALIFETDANLFYKLLQLSTLHTPSALEEEGFEEKEKRLSAEGIPDRELAFSIHQPLSLAEVKGQLSHPGHISPGDIRPIRPLIYSERLPRILQRLAQELKEFEAFESELSLLMNSAIVRYKLDLSEIEQVVELALSVRGAVCLGLEQCEQELQQSPIDAYTRLGLRKLYQLGLGALRELSELGQKLSEEDYQDSPEALRVLDGIRQQFPILPRFVNTDGRIVLQDGELEGGFSPFETLAQVKLAKDFLSAPEKVGE